MSFLRKSYYRLPPKWRFWVRRLYFAPADMLFPRAGIPPRGLIFTGGGDFLADGLAWKSRFQYFADLKPSQDFLDIGSGIGRIALGLRGFLTGKYLGFDAVETGIRWCQKHISTANPHFQFIHLDIFNDLYKESGKRADQISFPTEDESFDLAVAISVFTHMEPWEVEHYFREAHRCLRPGAKLLATFFVYEQGEQHIGPAHFSFPYRKEHHAYMDEQVKSANVAFEKSHLQQMAEAAGFKVAHFEKGRWNGAPASAHNDFQDIFVFTKI